MYLVTFHPWHWGIPSSHIPLPVCTRSPLPLLSGNSLAETRRSRDPCATNLWMGREWGNVGTRGYPATAVKEHPLPLTSRWGGETGRQVSDLQPGLPRSAARRARNVSTPLGQPRHSEWARRRWKTRTPPKPKQSVCARPGLSVMVYILWRCVNVGESVLGARVMDDLIWRDTESGTGGVCAREQGDKDIFVQFMWSISRPGQLYQLLLRAGVHVSVSGNKVSMTKRDCCSLLKDKFGLWQLGSNSCSFGHRFFWFFLMLYIHRVNCWYMGT